MLFCLLLISQVTTALLDVCIEFREISSKLNLTIKYPKRIEILLELEVTLVQRSIIIIEGLVLAAWPQLLRAI